jgi:hypothetical protein
MKAICLGVVLVSLLCLQIILGYGMPPRAQALSASDVYVGVDMAYGDSVAEAKRQIDEVSGYTNLFIIGCKGITYNTTRLNETCQYIFDKGLNFIVYRDTSLGRNSTWAEMAKQTWGDRFLGYYAFDEIGGWQIDMHQWRMVVDTPANYSDAANSFVNMSKYYLDRFTKFRNVTQFNLYTSDYALYWFDYEAGYDTVFAEFGWNYSRQLNIAQCRGAANMHSKDWGAIITWTYTRPPYLESGEELYKDLVLAYENGAKYIILFDSNEGWTQSVLKQEHLDALKRFWAYVKEKPRQNTQASDRVAYVLPKDYGYGFRGPNDKIWGFWEADNLTSKVCANLNYLLTKYDKKLDIIYDYNLNPGNTKGYSKLFYWNDSSLPLLTSSPTETPTSPGSPPPPTQTANPVPIEKPQSSIDYVPVVAIGAVVAVVAVPAYLLRKRQYDVTFTSTGIGPDHNGSVVLVDGESHDKYGASFWWDSGSRHTYEFRSKILVSRGKQYVKYYVLVSTSGLVSHQDGILTVSRSSSLIGNYRPIFEVSRN